MKIDRKKELKQQRKSIDPEGMWNAIAKFDQQLDSAANIPLPEVSFKQDSIHNILFCGMGGSAIGGDLVRAYYANNLKIPMMINRNYTLPGFVNETTLVIVSSYSGNTEETLNAFQLAQASGANIIGISSNGILSEKMRKKGMPLIQIPGGMQPRAALGFSFIPVTRMLAKLGLVERDIQSEIKETIQKVSELSVRYQKEDETNRAFKLAQAIPGSVPIFYTAPELTVIGIRWKGQMAENAQILALTNELPEMNHNEIMGWGELSRFLHKSEVFWMDDEATHPQIRKRIDITAELLEKSTRGMHRISTEGKSWMTRMFSLVYLGDWVSLYAALLQGVDPTKIENISLLKKRLL